MPDIAIRVSNLSKCYQIYDNPRDRLKQFVIPKLCTLIPPLRKFFNSKSSSSPLPLEPCPSNLNFYKEFWALKDVSFEIKKGETVGIIGRNGSGKSTLLQIICGTLTPTGGSVQTNGRIAALLELGSGFNPEFTGRENVYMNASVLGLSNDEIDARFDDIVAFADIGDFIEQPVKTYSSGMMVRLAFAVIAHVDADILIVDEALAVGDAFFTQKCMRFLRNFMKTGTVLFVSHDTGAIVNLCNIAILLKEGLVVKTGIPKEIIKHYLFELIEANQDITSQCPSETNASVVQTEASIEYRDMRQSFINASTLRNDIEIFEFNPAQEGLGTGNANVKLVRLLDKDNSPLSWVVGGEDVILEIQCLANREIDRPIVGFHFRDRLGQKLFGDNTYLAYQHNPIVVAQGSYFIARFEFRLPLLPTGDYIIGVAIAGGAQESHIQHNWLHDALTVCVHASSIRFGLVGVPMKKIHLEVNKIY